MARPPGGRSRRGEGWPVERLKPLLAGLAELIPWLKQWHNEVDPVYERMGDLWERVLEGQLHTRGLILDTMWEWTPPATSTRREWAAARQTGARSRLIATDVRGKYTYISFG